MIVAPGRSEVDVARTGLVCSLGRSPAQTILLLRAGHSALGRTPFGRPGRVLRMCSLRDLPADLVGFERLLQLAVPALRQALPHPEADGETDGETDEQVPLLLALPPADRVDDDQSAAAHFTETLRDRTGLRIDIERSRTVRAGHASGARLLAHAQDLLEQRDVTAVMVGGVDSYYHPELLRELDHDERLIGAGNTDGFLPGEAAAFVLLRRPSQPSAEVAPTGSEGADLLPAAQPRLCSAAAGFIPPETIQAAAAWWREAHSEPKPTAAGQTRRPAGGRLLASARRARGRARLALRRLARNSLVGGSSWWRQRHQSKGRKRRGQQDTKELPPDVTITMTELAEGVMAARSEGAVDWVLSDFNHGAERTDQWEKVARRLLDPEVVHSRLIGELGDVGAATMPTLLALACAHFELGCAPAPAALLAAHSDDGERGVVLLREAP
ncbi:MAG: hypothetical protein DRI90_09180 [Deltaproteobacteria bacterium]|nr:MAG: hypothetical protein DRI90_09180 [Deltaproteobacteria bacterium]